MRKIEHVCSGCGRRFATAQGLGLHFTAVRKRTGFACRVLETIKEGKA